MTALLLFFYGIFPSTLMAEPVADVKAAFIYNFAKFVEWPVEAFADPAAPFVLCSMGSHALDGRLALLAGREVQGRRIEVVDLASGERAPQSCQLLFVAGADPAAWQPVLEAIGNAPVLTIGDIAAFADKGGMIELRVDKGRLRFDVDLDTVQAANLRMGARVLQLASEVRRSP